MTRKNEREKGTPAAGNRPVEPPPPAASILQQEKNMKIAILSLLTMALAAASVLTSGPYGAARVVNAGPHLVVPSDGRLAVTGSVTRPEAPPPLITLPSWSNNEIEVIGSTPAIRLATKPPLPTGDVDPEITVIRHDGFHGRCPVCESKGLVSVVYRGWCTSTLMGTVAWYDTAGNYHFRDPNTSTCEHRCSTGHVFKVIYSGVEELILRPDGSRIR